MAALKMNHATIVRCCSWSIVLVILQCGLSARAEEPELVRLLFAGSSSTYWNDMPREVAKIVDGRLAARPGAPVRAEIVGRSGSDIRVYNEPGFKDYQYGVKKGQTFLEKIRVEKPHYVVLQVVCAFITSDQPKLGGAAHAEAVTTYCRAIRQAGGEPIFYEMGWQRDQERGQRGRARILELALQNRVHLYVPCSTAWARVYKERPALALQHPKDSAHPGDLGHFLNLACFYAALTGQSPVGKLPRVYPVWPHALGKTEPSEQARQAEAERLSRFRPDAYQLQLPKYMWRNMAMELRHTLDDATARYLETVAWEETARISQQLATGSRPQSK